MCPTFTDADVGKRVETAGGDLVGTVRLTEPETAYVDANDDVRDTLRALLEWESEENVVPLDASAVAEVTETAIRLEAGRSSPAASEEGRTGEGLEPSDEGMTEAGEERHPDMADAPPDGERTVTEERGEEEDR